MTFSTPWMRYCFGALCCTARRYGCVFLAHVHVTIGPLRTATSNPSARAAHESVTTQGRRLLRGLDARRNRPGGRVDAPHLRMTAGVLRRIGDLRAQLARRAPHP